MKTFFLRIALTAVSLAISLPCLAGSLDDYYLQQFGELPGTSLQKAMLMPTGPEEQAHCGTPLKHGLQRDWRQLQAATQKTLAKQLAATVLSNEATLLSSGKRFLIHYATTGADTPTPEPGYTLLSWVQKVADTFEEVYAYYDLQGYRLPQRDLPGGSPYNIYLRDLAGQKIYGQTTSDKSASSNGFLNAVTSFIEIDKDFTKNIYTKASLNFEVPVFTPLDSLQITAAHEFHHAIQYSYNIFFDIWYAEATSTWFEDELFDSVNQSYNYIHTWFNDSTQPLDASLNNGGGYSRWIFNRHLAENHGAVIVRNVWEKLAGIASPRDAQNQAVDIPMVPVIDNVLSTSSSPSSLSSEFFDFTKRVYTKKWITHTVDIPKIPNYTPVSVYATYPVNGSSTPSPSVSLPHYSFAYYKFTPSATATTLTISLAKTSGIQAAVFKKVSGTISEITANTGGASFTVSDFNTLNPKVDEVVLLIANTTGVDDHSANFSTDGSSMSVAEPVGNPTNISNVTIASGNGTIGTLTNLKPNDPLLSTATKPANFSATGALNLTITTDPGSTVTVKLFNLTSLPVNPAFYKVVGTKWIRLVQPTDYTLVENTITFSIKDNGPFDSDSRLGFIQDPFVVGTETSAPSGGGGGGGFCFIATAAYGSYLHPQVQVLRDFRDQYLLTNAPGQAFVAAYYRMSPPLADFISRHETLRLLVRLLLTPIIFAIANPGIVCLSVGTLLVGGCLLYIRRRQRSIFTAKT